MAIVQTGASIRFGVNSSANTGTVSATITVPADAEIVLVGISGYQGTNAGLAGCTFTKGAADTAMTKVPGDATNSLWQSALFYLNAPDTGTNKTLKWDWIGTGTSAQNFFIFSVTFWKGIDTASPVRDTDTSGQGALARTTPTLTALTGDLIVAFAGWFCNTAAASINTWSNLTLNENLLHSNDADGAWATGSPTGNTTVAASTGTNVAECSLMAIVLKPGGAGAQAITGVKFTSTNTFGTAVVGRGAVGITGVHFADADTFKTAVVSRGAVGITGVKFTDTDAFHTAVVTRGAVGITGVLFNDADSFGAATITRGAVTITGTLFIDGDTFGTATIDQAAPDLDITGVLFVDLDTFGAASLTSSYSIVSSHFDDTDTFGVATVGRGAASIIGSHFGDADTFHSGTIVISGAPQGITSVHFADPDAFHTALVRGLNSIQASHFADADAFGVNSVAAGTYNIFAAHFSDPDIFHVATLTGGLPPVIGDGAGGWLRRRRR